MVSFSNCGLYSICKNYRCKRRAIQGVRPSNYWHYCQFCPGMIKTLRFVSKVLTFVYHDSFLTEFIAFLSDHCLSSVSFDIIHKRRKAPSAQKGTSRQRSGKGAIRKRFPLQKPRWEKTKLTIRYLYHETYRKPNEQLFSQ